MFSKTALVEIDNIDEDLERLFDFYEGEILSWERKGISSGGHISYGKVTEINIFKIYFATDKKGYAHNLLILMRRCEQ